MRVVRPAGHSVPRTVGWLLAVILTIAPSAVAQDLSPQVDPDSPAGIEYQLPLERAREQASGDRRGSPGAPEQAPLFGVGIEPADRASASGDRRDRRADAPGARSRRSAQGLPAPAIIRAQARPPERGITQLLAVGAAGTGVLLVGWLAGLGWRRRAQRG